MLRLIGKGSYGEVWLARSVTGAMRAVKVVQRSDFQYRQDLRARVRGDPEVRADLAQPPRPGRRAARRPQSRQGLLLLRDGARRRSGARCRDHPRAVCGADTLASDINQREDGRLSVDECIEAGANLADGLHYLHQRGLTHRDVKPSNVIFVEGVAKLADIGLVAASGQRTFVGTEGFVPPEGPGSPAADIYSLGDGALRGEHRKRPARVPGAYRADCQMSPSGRSGGAMNAVVCKACSQKPKDRYAEAGRVRAGASAYQGWPRPPQNPARQTVPHVMWAGLLAALIMFSRHRDYFEAMRDSR